MSDIEAMNLGTVWCLNANTELGQTWLDENLQVEPWQKVGDSVVIEARMITDIIDGIEEDELTVCVGS